MTDEKDANIGDEDDSKLGFSLESPQLMTFKPLELLQLKILMDHLVLYLSVNFEVDDGNEDEGDEASDQGVDGEVDFDPDDQI